jgi:hypothetical protein
MGGNRSQIAAIIGIFEDFWDLQVGQNGTCARVETAGIGH